MSFSRYTGFDIRDKIIDILENGATPSQGTVKPSLKDSLIGIDKKRNTNTPPPKNINYNWSQNQFPFVLVDMEDSEILQDEELTNDYEITTEVYRCRVVFHIKATWKLVQNYAENYIEAIIECLNAYTDSNITWILPVETDKIDVYTKENQTMKTGMVLLEVRIN